MKLASLDEGGRDGTLVVVDGPLARAVRVPGIARTLQEAIERWDVCSPALQEVYLRFQRGDAVDAFTFDPEKMLAPLPRAFHWVDGGGYLPHLTLMRQARGAKMPEKVDEEPLFVQGNSDRFWSCRDPILLADDAWGIDIEGEIGIVVDDVPMGVSAAEARRHIKLLVLLNDVSLRNLIPAELAKGFGFYQSKPNKAFAPVAITPDEAGSAWDGALLNVEVHAYINNQLLGHPNSGRDALFDFPRILEHANKTRSMAAGTIVGGGTVSNWDRSLGHVCIHEKRALEITQEGQARTPFMTFGDRVRIEARSEDGRSLFGTIEQTVVRYRK